MLLKRWFSRRAEKLLSGEVNSFLKDMQLQMGAQLFVMAAYEKSDGSVSTAKYIIWKEL